MNNRKHKTRLIRVCAVSSLLMVALGCLSVSWQRLSAQAQKAPATTYPAKRMQDGKPWMTRNLDVNIMPSYCYDDAESNCRRYGRLYTWESARRACQSLGNEWRLPTDDEWRQLAKHYGGVSADSEDKGKAAYKDLLDGGSSGFDAVLGGGRSPDGQYARLDAHGFYWAASEIDPANGSFYNFAGGGQALHRQEGGGEKQSAFSVRCVKGYQGARRAVGWGAVQLSPATKILLSLKFLASLFFGITFLRSQQRPRTRGQIVEGVGALVLICAVALDLFREFYGGHLRSSATVNALYLSKQLVSGAIIGVLAFILHAKSARIVLIAAAAIFVGLLAFEIAYAEIRHVPVRGWLLCFVGFPVGMAIPSVVFLWLDRNGNGEVDNNGDAAMVRATTK